MDASATLASPSNKMTKKKDTLRTFLPYLPAIGIAVGVIAGYVNLQADTKNNKTKVEKLETDTKTEIDKVKTDIKEIANEGDKEIKDLQEKDNKLERAVEVNQVKQEEISRKVGEVKQATDKIMELLLEMQQKKK